MSSRFWGQFCASQVRTLWRHGIDDSRGSGNQILAQVFFLGLLSLLLQPEEPEEARTILQNAVDARQSIGIYEILLRGDAIPFAREGRGSRAARPVAGTRRRLRGCSRASSAFRSYHCADAVSWRGRAVRDRRYSQKTREGSMELHIHELPLDNEVVMFGEDRGK